MRIKTFLIFSGILIIGCLNRQKIDINKLTTNYFKGYYKSSDLSGIKIDLLIKDSIYYCSYTLKGINMSDSGSWYLFSYENIKELVFENFPIDFIHDQPEYRFRKNKISFEIDCDSDLGDLNHSYSSGEREFKFIKIDKSKNKDFLK